MRIALVYPRCHQQGGVERVVFEAAQYLSRRHDVTLICGSQGVEELPESVTTMTVGAASRSEFLGTLAFRRNARRALERLRPEVSVAFGNECPGSDVQVVGSVHAAWLMAAGSVRLGGMTVPGRFRRILPRHRLRLWLERDTWHVHPPLVAVAVNERVADDLCRFYGLERARIRVVPNGFDPRQCSPARRNAIRDSARAALGVTTGARALLLVANEWHRKGLDVLLHALGRLEEPRPLLFLVGRQAPDAYRSVIDRLALRDSVRFLGAMDDVGVAYAVADLFVLPTQYEPFGQVIIEALASGLPVIASEVAGAAAVLKPGLNGLVLHDPHDPDTLAALLRHSLEPGILEEWGRAGPETVRDYAWDVVMARFEELLEETAGLLSPDCGR